MEKEEPFLACWKNTSWNQHKLVIACLQAGFRGVLTTFLDGQAARPAKTN